MYVIVGLGNPGKQYDSTRHNVGFEVIDQLARRHNIPVVKSKYKALVGEGMIDGKKVMLVKPQTFMNLSGESVMRIVEYYDLPLDNLMVIYDDLDTDVGKLRIRAKGSAGSHNGMKNIIYLLKEDVFPRVRVGIGRPEHGAVRDFVLQRFAKDQVADVEDSILRACDAVECYMEKTLDIAMNNYNG